MTLPDRSDPVQEEGLKPCPFCGGEAFLVQSAGFLRMECSRNYCGTSGPHAPDNLGATQKWNRRSPSPPPEREQLARWMIEHSFATGHGDTTADLLAELGTQVDELRAELAPPSERGAVEDKAAILECLCRARCAEFSVDPDKIINREGEEIHQWRWMVEKADLDLADAIFSRLGRV